MITMNTKLKTTLMALYQEDQAWQIRNSDEAAKFYEAKNFTAYLDLSLHLRLPDTCWALGKWDEAYYWYRHNANIFTEYQNLYKANNQSNQSSYELIDCKATTFIKAGFLDTGYHYLEDAIVYWQNQSEPQLVLSQLGLHAAQIGANQFSHFATLAAEARQILPGPLYKPAKRIRSILHYEPSQVALLQQNWQTFEYETEKINEIKSLLEVVTEPVFPIHLHNALFAAIQGLYHVSSLHKASEPKNDLYLNAKNAFEQAMFEFYNFSGYLDWNVYFMRLNISLIDDIMESRKLLLNPFAINSSNKSFK